MGMSLLTAVEVKNAGVGKHHDGRGLFLRVYKSGSRCWVLRLTVDGRRRGDRLGRLARSGPGRRPPQSPRAPRGRRRRARPARRQAPRRRADVQRGGEGGVGGEQGPVAQRADRGAVVGVAGEPRVCGHRRHGRGPRISQSDVLGCVEPIWTTRTETARKVRQRIRTVLRWCQAHGYVTANAAGEAIDGGTAAHAPA